MRAWGCRTLELLQLRGEPPRKLIRFKPGHHARGEHGIAVHSQPSADAVVRTIDTRMSSVSDETTSGFRHAVDADLQDYTRGPGPPAERRQQERIALHLHRKRGQYYPHRRESPSLLPAARSAGASPVGPTEQRQGCLRSAVDSGSTECSYASRPE